MEGKCWYLASEIGLATLLHPIWLPLSIKIFLLLAWTLWFPVLSAGMNSLQKLTTYGKTQALKENQNSHCKKKPVENL